MFNARIPICEFDIHPPRLIELSVAHSTVVECRNSRENFESWTYGTGTPQYTAPRVRKSARPAEYTGESYQRVGLSRLMRVFSNAEQHRLTCQHHLPIVSESLQTIFEKKHCLLPYEVAVPSLTPQAIVDHIQ